MRNARPLALDPRWRTQPVGAGVALEGSHGVGGSGRDHRARQTARARIPRADRRRLLLGMVVVEDLALPEGGAGCVPRGGELGRARRLRSGVARRRERSRKDRALGVRRRAQGDVFGQWGGLPAKMFLARLDPDLAALRDRLYDEALPPGQPAGQLCAEWARLLDLPEGMAIAMGGFDAHYGAVGSGIEPGTLVKIIGTSTCDCAISPIDSDGSRVAQGKPAASGMRQIPGICGIVKGSILPGYYGIEAGQSAVGDLLSWWVEGVGDGTEAVHLELSNQAARLEPGQSGLLALDWNNGNRTVLVDARLTGAARRTDAAHDARRDLSRADRGHRLWRAHHRRAAARVRRADRARGVLRRDRRQERPVHADLC